MKKYLSSARLGTLILIGFIILIGIYIYPVTGVCNVAELNIRGEIVTYFDSSFYNENGESIADGTSSEDIRDMLIEIKYDENIEAILIVIDSRGGTPVASEEIMNSLKNLGKPVISVIRESATSGAYYAISGSDIIFASKNSRVGSIGVTKSYVSNVEKNKKDGLAFIELNTGKFKDTMDPNKPLSESEIEYLKNGLQTLYKNFTEAVSTNRGIDTNTVKEIANGSVYYGEEALKIGLIDKIGGYFEAITYIEKTLDRPTYICEF